LVILKGLPFEPDAVAGPGRAGADAGGQRRAVGGGGGALGDAAPLGAPAPAAPQRRRGAVFKELVRRGPVLRHRLELSIHPPHQRLVVVDELFYPFSETNKTT